MEDDRVTPGQEADAVRRIGEERAGKILERAAALDARRASEVEVGQLREAAALAGISPQAFEEAMREEERESDSGAPAQTKGGQALVVPRPPRITEVDFTRYAAALQDILGDDGKVTVVEDRIQWQGSDGVTVSVRPSSSGATAAVSAEGRLGRRILAAVLPWLVPAFFMFVILASGEEEAGLVFVGMLMGLAASLLGLFVSHRRERRQLRAKVERIRRQLHRLLGIPPDSV